jgi:nucleotide-binding universal stress UspA family protein
VHSSALDPTRPDPERAAVVVGVDGSEAATEAARAGAVEAVGRHAPLVLVHAFDWPSAGVEGLTTDVDGRSVARRSAARDLGRLAASLTDRLPTADVRTELLDGSPADVLRARSVDAALLVVGTHGQTRSSGTALGSVASAVASGSACPVLLHRTVHPLDVHHAGVTVGIDGGPGSNRVLAAAAREANRRGVALTVVHTLRQLTEDATRELRWVLDTEATAASDAAHVAGLVRELSPPRPERRIPVLQLTGRAGPALVRAGDSSDLLVIGRPAAPGGQGLRATTHEVASRARVPVLLVPLPAEERADTVTDRPCWPTGSECA